MGSESVSLATARAVARILEQHALVEGVDVFGSVARAGRGKDLDVVVLVKDIVSAKFIAETKKLIQAQQESAEAFEEIMGPAPESALSPREEAAIKVLGGDFLERVRKSRAFLPELRGQSPLDLFVLPSNWRDRAEELEEVFPQGDKKFWKEATAQALRL